MSRRVRVSYQKVGVRKYDTEDQARAAIRALAGPDATLEFTATGLVLGSCEGIDVYIDDDPVPFCSMSFALT